MAASGPSTLLQRMRQSGRMRCGVLSDFEPFGFRQEGSQDIVGYEIDMARELARYLGIAFEPVEITAAQRLTSLLEGRVDLLAALMSKNPERSTQMDFSGIYSKDVNQLLVRADAGMAHADDIGQGTIGALVGTSLPQVAKARYPDVTVRLFDDAASACQGLVAGKVDGIFLRTTSLIALQRAHPDAALVILPQVLLAPETAFAVRKGEPDLLREIDAFLAGIEQDGNAQRIYDRWLGSGSPYRMTRTFAVGAPAVGHGAPSR